MGYVYRPFGSKTLHLEVPDREEAREDWAVAG